MNKVLNFIKSPMGKWIIAIVIILIISYIAFVQYQKSIYNGLSKKDVENNVKSLFAKDTIDYIKTNDDNLLQNRYTLAEVLSYYDENQTSTLDSAKVAEYLGKLGISSDRRSDFSGLNNQQIMLVNYI